MAIRIVNEDGIGYHTKVLDTETGEDLTTRLSVGAIHVDLDPAKAVTAHLTIWTPPIDITVEEAEIKQVCPYCGHSTKEVNKPELHVLPGQYVTPPIEEQVRISNEFNRKQMGL